MCWAAGGAGGGVVLVESDCANAGATPRSAANARIATNVERCCLMMAPREMSDARPAARRDDRTRDERRAILGALRARVNDPRCVRARVIKRERSSNVQSTHDSSGNT